MKRNTPSEKNEWRIKRRERREGETGKETKESSVKSREKACAERQGSERKMIREEKEKE